MVTNMVNLEVKNEQGEKVYRQLTADEGKLLFSVAEINELGETGEGFPNIIIPLDWDFESMYVEKEADFIEIKIENVTE